MHRYAKEIAEKVKCKVEDIGIDNLDTASICELEKWICICEKIAKMDYYCKIIDAMEESEYGVDYDVWGRKGYSEPKYHMTPKEYHAHTPEELRDMDRRMGRMYYTESTDSRYEMAKKHYTENKASHPDDNSSNLKAIEMLANTISDDMRELKSKMSHEEKTMVKQKLLNMANDIM